MTAFDTFWDIYPRKAGKGAAQKSWDRAVKNGALPALIIVAATKFRDDRERQRKAIEFTAHPSTWLNQQRWLDEPDQPELEPEPEIRTRYESLPVGIDFVEFLQQNPDMAERIANLVPKPNMQDNPINAGLAMLIKGYV